MAQVKDAIPTGGQSAVVNPRADDFVTHRELWAMASRVDRHFHRMGRKLDQCQRENNEHFSQLKGKFDQLDGKFNQLGDKFGKLDGKFNKLEGNLNQFQEETNQRFAKVDDRFNRLERKVDINQEKTNTQFAQMKNSITLTILSIVGVAVAILGFLIETK